VGEPDADTTGPEGDGDTDADADLDGDDGVDDADGGCVEAWLAPVPAGKLNVAGVYDGTPRLSEDGLTVYFSSKRPGGVGQEDIWTASRPRRSARFGTPTLVAGVNSAAGDVAPHPSPDGLRLYFGTYRADPAHQEIWMASRAAAGEPFGSATRLAELDSDTGEAWPWLSHDELLIYFFSYRPPLDAHGLGDIWRARRTDRSAPFGSIEKVPGVDTGWQDEAPFLTADSLALYFNQGRVGEGPDCTILVARRRSTADPFDPPVAVAGIDTPLCDQMGWISADEAELFMTSVWPEGSSCSGAACEEARSILVSYSACRPDLYDPDSDGVHTRVSGTVCAGGATTGCDDNCPETVNPGQDDADGDAIGDACQCARYEADVMPEASSPPLAPYTYMVGTSAWVSDGVLTISDPSGAPGSFHQYVLVDSAFAGEDVVLEARVRIESPTSLDAVGLSFWDGRKNVWLAFESSQVGFHYADGRTGFIPGLTATIDTSGWHSYRITKRTGSEVELSVDGVVLVRTPYADLADCGSYCSGAVVGFRFGSACSSCTSVSHWDYVRWRTGTAEMLCSEWPPPAPPAPLAPENGALTGSIHAPPSFNVLRPLFRWRWEDDGHDAPRYEIQVDDSCTTPGFASCGFPSPEAEASGIPDLSWRPATDLPVSTAPPVGRRYYWRVRACRGTTCSPWSPVRYVDVGRVRADFNGDGWSDVFVGARTDGGATRAGSVRLYLGAASPTATPDRVIPGAADGDQFGQTVGLAGDVNADGFADVLVGAPMNDDRWTNAGQVYLFFGNPAADVSPDWVFRGEAADDRLGGDCVAAGDVDADGYADPLITTGDRDGPAPDVGAAYLFRGGPSLSSIPQATITGAASADWLGRSCSASGDVNGDGYADVLAGVPGSDAPGVDVGRVILLLGSPLLDLDVDLVIDGPVGPYFGFGVAHLGDVDGDGFGDWVAADPQFATYRGVLFLFRGGDTVDPVPDVRLEGEGPWNDYALSIAGCDLDGNALTDMTVGARANSGGGPGAGRVYSYLASGDVLSATPAYVWTGSRAQENLGHAIACAGDVNGDGRSDLVLGAPAAITPTIPGRVYLHLGGPTFDGSPELTYTNEVAGDQFGYSVQ
jgi:hypothetical protein